MNLEALKVKSFVTNMEEGAENTAKGGTILFTRGGPGCPIIIQSIACPSRGFCPSWADGCGSALGCTDTILTDTIKTDTIIIDPIDIRTGF